MSGRYMAYDAFDHLFDGGFQQQTTNHASNGNNNKSHQQPSNMSPYNLSNNNRVGGPSAEDYDPAAFLAASGQFNSASAMNNAGAQLIAAATGQNSNTATTIPQYGLYRPSGPTNPALIQNTLQQQAVFRHHQQQQQQQHRHHQHHQHQQQHQHQQAVRAALITDYDSVGSRQQQQHAPRQQQQHHAHMIESLIMPSNIFSKDFEVPGVDSISDGSSDSPPPAWLQELKIEVSGLALEPLSGAEVMDRLRNKTSDVIKRFLPCVDFLVMCQQELRKGLAVATQKRLIRRAYRDALTPRQFHQKYIAGLPQRFITSNRYTMEANYLKDAYEEVQNLSNQARAAERQGCEAMKNTFLGGMKDGESWGLRKWLSRHGGALQICTDLELILAACQKLNKELDSTKQLAGLMRPLAKKALDRLRSDVPQSYQEVSTAHPYLPFFHRLEAALRGMSNFDPEDDDVICLDDSDDDEEPHEVVKPAAKLTPAKLKREPSGVNSSERPQKRQRSDPVSANASRKAEPVARYAGNGDNNNNGDDSDSDIEIVGVKPAAKATVEDDESDAGDGDSSVWTCNACNHRNVADAIQCDGCSLAREFLNDLMKFEDVMNVKTGLSDDEDDIDTGAFSLGGCTISKASTTKRSADDFVARTIVNQSPPPPPPPPPPRKATPVYGATYSDALKLSAYMDSLADVFEIGQQGSIRPNNAPVQLGSFWDGEMFGKALRLFADILRQEESVQFLEPVDEESVYMHPPYSSVVKNPLSFHEIVSALVPENFNNLEDSGCDGVLPQQGLSFWNMWNGIDLFQAIDLVLLNALGYTKISQDKGRSKTRSDANRIRKRLWAGINEMITQQVGESKELQKQYAPTRRGETSGFVILKSRGR